jgi:hypothetical protein
MALLQNRVGSAARACYRRLAWGVTKGEATVTISADQKDFDSSAVLGLREDLALALRAAALHGLAEGVCNHFSVELPDGSGRFLLNPRGLLWSEVQAGDIVLVDARAGCSRGATPSRRRRCSSMAPSIAWAGRPASCTPTCRTRPR